MKLRSYSIPLYLIFLGVLLGLLSSCKPQTKTPTTESANTMDLKRGKVILCGPPDGQFGTVRFANSCSPKTQTDFDLGIALLHSFEYDEAEKVFAKIIDQEPACAMAYWGVAMSNYHQVWPSPPTPAELEKGAKALAIARAIPGNPKRETDYINAITTFYQDWATTDHRTRSLNFTKAMETLYKSYPEDKEAAVFYALSLVGSADPADKSYRNQQQAGAILSALYPGRPNHPGIVHYIIHSYDYPELAALALPFARKYAAIAPSSAHAQHMPSHIFTRLGLWEECIQSNRAAASSAQCYAEGAGMKGHWDEELHAMDYLVYGYLQKGENTLAQQQLDYLNTITDVSPANFKVAYAYAAIPARYYLENKLWKEAAGMKLHPAHFPWHKFPWQKSIFHFARLLGAVHTGNFELAKRELTNLHRMHDTLVAWKDVYKANQVLTQLKAGEAWLLFGEGRKAEALQRMKLAADMEDKTEKSPVTPGEVLPASELVADMLLALNQPAEALSFYEADLKKHPGRFNGLHGAALASQKIGNLTKTTAYYQQLLATAHSPRANRPELAGARSFLEGNH